MSVLPKNRQLVFSIQSYIWDKSEIFSISSLVKISLTSFLCFSSSFLIFETSYIYVIKRKYLKHVGLNVHCTHLWNIFPLEDKLHMFVSPCNILYLLYPVLKKIWKTKCQTWNNHTSHEHGHCWCLCFILTFYTKSLFHVTAMYSCTSNT